MAESEHDYSSVLGKPISPSISTIKPYILSKMKTLIGDQRANANANPGAQPTSIDREKLRDFILKDDDYFITEKADGERFICLLLRSQTIISELKLTPETVSPDFITMPKEAPDSAPYDPVTTYLISRKLDIYKLDIIYPPYFVAPDGTLKPDQHHFMLDSGLFDGELIYDKSENGREAVFYIFDSMSYAQGKSLLEKHLTFRLKMGSLLLSKVFEEFKIYGEANKIAFKSKKFYPKNFIGKMFSEILPNLPHENDGIIFTPGKDPYRCGTCPRLIKWKPKEMNSVDFAIKRSHHTVIVQKIGAGGQLERSQTAISVPIYTLHFAKQGTITEPASWLDNIFIEPPKEFIESWKDYTKNTHQPIVECVPTFTRPGIVFKQVDRSPQGIPVVQRVFDPSIPSWKIMRVRTDRVIPNEQFIYQNIMRSVKDCIEKDGLIKDIMTTLNRNKAEGANKSQFGTRSRSEASERKIEKRGALAFGSNNESLAITPELEQNVPFSKIRFIREDFAWNFLAAGDAESTASYVLSTSIDLLNQLDLE